MAEPETIFAAAGGTATFEALVDHFYAAVATDPILRPMYPEDLDPPRRRLALFLIQYFGGPATYSDERGHPRLRMRHIPFAIDQTARDRWISHMTGAVNSLDLSAAVRDELLGYLEGAATFMINRGG